MKKVITETARSLRKNPTAAEELLWNHIKDRQLGKKFRRQHPLQFKIKSRKTFIVADFYCRESRLIIELDGTIHEQYKEYDSTRDGIAESYGYKTLRFTNDEVQNNIKHVIARITSVINQE